METNFNELDADKILGTLTTLQTRIEERFPGSGLSRLCKQFTIAASELKEIANRINKPYYGLRLLITLVVIGLLIFLVLTGNNSYKEAIINNTQFVNHLNPTVLFSTIESIINDLIFVSLAIYFLYSIEIRIKRKTTLNALHHLRNLAHIIDMHQLTKDPIIITNPQPTLSSPKRMMTPFELERYLDYCSEMLSIISKIGALFSQNLPDDIINRHVNDLNDLTQGLSAKIWQKIMIMDDEVENN